MNDDVQRKMSESSHAFLRCVWPAVAEQLGGGEVIPVECTSTDEWAKQLDLLAGIDLWQVVNNGMGLRGVASRVQWVKDRGTFTIRETGRNGSAVQTEWQKRQYALVYRDNGIISPYWMIHAYMRPPAASGSLVRVGIIETSQLIRYVMESISNTGVRGPGEGPNTDGVGRNRNREDGRIFLYADWRSLKRAGVEVKIVSGQMSMVVTP
jgi:hypothetical protein